jgi:hypothetical protein
LEQDPWNRLAVGALDSQAKRGKALARQGIQGGGAQQHDTNRLSASAGGERCHRRKTDENARSSQGVQCITTMPLQHATPWASIEQFVRRRRDDAVSKARELVERGSELYR